MAEHEDEKELAKIMIETEKLEEVDTIYEILKGNDNPKKLLKEVRRFYDDLKRLNKKQLKEMESVNIISRYSYNEVPPRVEYSLTEKGKELISVIDGMRDWGQSYIDMVLQDNKLSGEESV